MVRDGAKKAVEIEPAQAFAEILGQRIANAVGMPETLTLDHFDFPLIDRRTVHRFNYQIQSTIPQAASDTACAARR
jgi:hypothetical protein